MLRTFAVSVILLASLTPLVAQVHEEFQTPCTTLWPAVKDVVRNSGGYAPLYIDNAEMVASFAVEGDLGGLRIESAVLTPNGSNCSLLFVPKNPSISHDASELRKRLELSLKRSQPSSRVAPANKDAGSASK